MSTETINTNIPSDVANAVWKNITLNNGYDSNFFIYTPKNINEKTPIILYEHGGGTLKLVNGDLGLYNLELYHGNIPAIVICYNRADYQHNGYNYRTKDTLLSMPDILKYVENTYGVSADNLNIVGFSAGFTESLCDAAKYRMTYPDAPIKPIILLDAYYNDTHSSQHQNRAAEAMKVLGKSGDIIFAFHQPKITSNQLFYEKCVKEYGVNLLWIEDRRVNETGATIVDHQKINDSYITNDLIWFNLGIKPFPKGDYKVTRYIKKTNENGTTTWEWVQVDIEGMTIYEVYELFGIATPELLRQRITFLSTLTNVPYYLSSDSNVLNSSINNVLGKIRSSNFVQSNMNFDLSFGSTSQVPKEIPSIIQSFFTKNATFLTILANDMYSINSIGESIETLNQKLEELTENLNVPTEPNYIKSEEIEFGEIITEKRETTESDELPQEDDYIIEYGFNYKRN